MLRAGFEAGAARKSDENRETEPQRALTKSKLEALVKSEALAGKAVIGP
jgi:hypothetical protein